MELSISNFPNRIHIPLNRDDDMRVIRSTQRGARRRGVCDIEPHLDQAADNVFGVSQLCTYNKMSFLFNHHILSSSIKCEEDALAFFA